MHQNIRNHGWLQGAIVPPSMYKDIGITGISPTDIVILISQSCDILAESFDDEPFVEYVIAKVEPVLDGNYSEGKHPRYYDFKTDEQNGPVYRVFFHNRGSCNRAILANYAPAAHLGEQGLQLAKWFGRKYARLALPDEYNERVKLTKKALKNAVKGSHNYVEYLFIGLNSFDELPQGTPYSGMIIIAHSRQLLENQEIMTQLNLMATKISQILNACKGISIEVEVVPTNEINLEMLESLKRFDTFDYLSD